MTGRLADLFQPRAPPVAGLGAATELQPEPEPELEGRQQHGSGLGTGKDADALYITHRLSFAKFQTDDSLDVLPRQAKDNNRALKTHLIRLRTPSINTALRQTTASDAVAEAVAQRLEQKVGQEHARATFEVRRIKLKRHICTLKNRGAHFTQTSYGNTYDGKQRVTRVVSS